MDSLAETTVNESPPSAAPKGHCGTGPRGRAATGRWTLQGRARLRPLERFWARPPALRKDWRQIRSSSVSPRPFL